MQFLEANARRVVVKIGTNSITGIGGALLTERIDSLCEQIGALKQQGFEVLVISSGSIGMGVGRLALPGRPSDLTSLQACAAVGQSRLMEAWQKSLDKQGITAAQILLTREDVRGRRRHLAIRSTLEQLLDWGVVPVVNENDTVSADEIKFGDNDVLSALVASLVKADLLVILSTIPGLMKDWGRGDLIPVVNEITDEIRAMAGGALNERSTGGMVTKIEAAKLATQSGCGVFIGSASEPGILEQINSGTAQGTFFVPQALSLAA
ncbi:MAG TPA: glutamate 5-kinase, partial [Oceanipulchritudo sp.]|nr:glutamate 5-kinase [Oceanipulchritudo sp.]